jgi:hypothetical protein
LHLDLRGFASRFGLLSDQGCFERSSFYHSVSES